MPSTSPWWSAAAFVVLHLQQQVWLVVAVGYGCAPQGESG